MTSGCSHEYVMRLVLWSEEHAAARRKTNLESHVRMAELLAVKLYTGF